MTKRRTLVEKVFAYITHDVSPDVTRGARLLIFRHPESPEVGLQVPAGTIEASESHAAAVLREAHEETGLEHLELRARLGTRDFDATPYGRHETHRRYFFHLQARGPVRESWLHYERHASGSQAPIPFEFRWVPLFGDVPPLHADHDAMLEELRRVLTR